MSDTPRTDAAYFKEGGTTPYDLAGEMKKLELELAAADQRIERLVTVGDAIVENGSVSESLFEEWSKAKESKP